MSYEETVHDVVKVVEAVGASIMVFGGLVVFAVYVPRMLSPAKRPGSYEALRRQLGRCILVGLEVLIVADIVQTIIVEQTIESVVVLGVIVIVRILLSFSLEVEMDGIWPWNRWRRADADAGS
jgi:uncharacterized membrane protein